MHRNFPKIRNLIALNFCVDSKLGSHSENPYKTKPNPPSPWTEPPSRQWVHYATLLVATAISLTAQQDSLAANAPTLISFDQPSIDKWIYPFTGGGGGTRPSGPTFGAIGTVGFDDRDGQHFASFATAGKVTTGQGAENYLILSATFTLSLSASSVVLFDGTYDPKDTYGPDGGAINGDDPGRPIELYGAAYRNGITSSTVTNETPFTTAAGISESNRSIYPTDFIAGVSINGTNRDVSNNIADNFDPVPFAIGQVAPGDLNADGTIKAYADVVFTLNLANPDVLRFLQLSLNEGYVNLLATSLHQASQGGPTTYPDFYTNDNLLGVPPGRLEISVQVVPEPSALTMLLCGFGVMVACWRGRRVLQFPEDAQ